MATASHFTRTLSLADLKEPSQSVGAHLAAKLDLFSTDERTLTDELCDMLCIWLGGPLHAKPPTTRGPFTFTLSLAKTTPSEEFKNGADLELKIVTPLGTKRCLIQAKVLDPATGKLRCDHTKGWRKLRAQLASAKAEVGSLAFLLVYVPGRFLNGRSYGHSTYEQAFLSSIGGVNEAFYGATLIAADDLLGESGRWRRKAKVPQSIPGIFKNGVPLWKFLFELLLCSRGIWTSADTPNVKRPIEAFRSLCVSAGEISPSRWTKLQESKAQWLEDAPPNKG